MSSLQRASPNQTGRSVQTLTLYVEPPVQPKIQPAVVHPGCALQPIQVFLQLIFLAYRAELVLPTAKGRFPIHLYRSVGIRASDHVIQRGCR